MTYTYLCSCGTEFDIQQRITDPVEATCINCGDKTTKRLINGGGTFILKGGMWAKGGYSSGIREQIRSLPEAEDDE